MSSTGSRSRVKWRTLPELLDVFEALIKMLLADAFPSWAGKLCPRCKGKLSKLQGSKPKHRCNHKSCQVYINAHHLHPLFADGRGTAAMPLCAQKALLMLKLNNISACLASTAFAVLHACWRPHRARRRDGSQHPRSFLVQRGSCSGKTKNTHMRDGPFSSLH